MRSAARLGKPAPSSPGRQTDVETLPWLRDVLVVTPEAGAVGFYSDWYAGSPKWETYHLLEVRQLLERGYGAGHRRVVAGLSMGGFGVLSYAARHRGLSARPRPTAAW